MGLRTVASAVLFVLAGYTASAALNSYQHYKEFILGDKERAVATVIVSLKTGRIVKDVGVFEDFGTCAAQQLEMKTKLDKAEQVAGYIISQCTKATIVENSGGFGSDLSK